ncbi:MAG: DinB family protein [Candidatus Rokubacteria bacterium]|nr:DinB family protein [Candidatus Rokubacteria bacterium]
MPHPLVDQLRFARKEFRRGLEGVSAEDAARRLEPMNPIAWMVGHLAWHEQLLWLDRAQNRIVAPEVQPCGFGAPAANPPLAQMWAAWRTITEAADPYLDALTPELLLTHFERDRRRPPESIGTSLRRLTYHYFFHIGESQAVRQLLGHRDLPTFVGEIGAEAPYRPEGLP